MAERELEQAIIDRIEGFLPELSKGFCFVARQKRITLDGDHFFVDLVFYNRLLRCFVLVDIKLGKLTHQDLGQMQMYVHLYDETERAGGQEIDEVLAGTGVTANALEPDLARTSMMDDQPWLCRLTTFVSDGVHDE